MSQNEFNLPTRADLGGYSSNITHGSEGQLPIKAWSVLTLFAVYSHHNKLVDSGHYRSLGNLVPAHGAQNQCRLVGLAMIDSLPHPRWVRKRDVDKLLTSCLAPRDQAAHTTAVSEKFFLHWRYNSPQKLRTIGTQLVLRQGCHASCCDNR